MKILILSNKLPYPPRDGGSIATHNMILGLESAGHHITSLSLNTRKHNFPVEKIPVPPDKNIRFLAVDCDSSIKPFSLILNLLFSRRPYIAERFRTSIFRKRLTRLLDQESFDLVQLEGPYMGHYLNDIRERSTASISIRAHNVEHLIWMRKSENERSVWKSWYLKNMALRLEKFENQIIDKVDLLLPISPKDDKFFKSSGHSQPSLVIPAGLRLEDYTATPLPGEPSIFFIGALDWLPNQEGLVWFLENVYPGLMGEIPDLQIHVAGRNAPTPFVKKLHLHGIQFHGEVEDAKSFMRSYRVMIAPLLTGSGIRVKILEAMALGRPVITTSIGMEGIPADPGKHLLLADDPVAFMDQIIGLINQPQLAQQLVTKAQQLIRHNFDTFSLSTRLSKFYQSEA